MPESSASYREGIATLRFDFPLMEEGRKKVDSKAVATAAIAEAIPLHPAGKPGTSRAESNALEVNGRTEAGSDTFEIVGVTRDHQISARERSNDNRCVYDVAIAGAGGSDSGSARAELVEVLDAATSQ